MGDIKLYESIVDKTIKQEIKEANWCMDLIQYATYKCRIDGLIAAACLFCPEIIQIKDYIFIKKFCNFDMDESLQVVRNLEEQYDNDKKSIEMSVNTWSLGDFFVGDSGEIMDNEMILQQFGSVIVYFWKQRARELFPEKEVIVELGNDLMGEFGLCITMYEDD